MCPARRPGYTDEWLLPMIEEIVRDYRSTASTTTMSAIPVMRARHLLFL